MWFEQTGDPDLRDRLENINACIVVDSADRLRQHADRFGHAYDRNTARERAITQIMRRDERVIIARLMKRWASAKKATPRSCMICGCVTRSMIVVQHADLLAAALAPLDGTDLECDGTTQAAVTVLYAAGVPHSVYGGQLVHRPSGNRPPIHFWIEINGLTLDFRARMWLGSGPEVPHGLFSAADYPGVTYTGRVGTFESWSPDLFEVFTGLELAPLVENVRRAVRGDAPLVQAVEPCASLEDRISAALAVEHVPAMLNDHQAGYRVSLAGAGHVSVRYSGLTGQTDVNVAAKHVTAYQQTLEAAGFVVFRIEQHPACLVVLDVPGWRSHSQAGSDQR